MTGSTGMSGRAVLDLLETTEKDPVNITVYGNPVLDVLVDAGRTARHVVERSAIEKVATIRFNGNLEFRPDTYVSLLHQGLPVVWGPFNANNQEPIYRVGSRYRVPLHVGEAAQDKIDSCGENVGDLPDPHRQIGGGGPNVLFGFYDVFAGLRVELIATVEKPSAGKLGLLHRHIKPLTKKIGPYTEVPIYEQPGINLVIEGLGYPADRTIFQSPIPTAEDPLDNIPQPRGKSIMVNTVYSPQIAIDALAHACSANRFAVLALTKSLCSKTRVDTGVWPRVLKNHHLLGIRDDVEFGSVYDFVTQFVLPNGRCICVFNEEELQHFTDVHTYTEEGDTNIPTLGGIIAAIKRVREFQKGRRDRIYVTAGPSGSFVLNEEDDLLYAAVFADQTRTAQTKTAIGDTYATFLLALETIGNYLGPYRMPASNVIRTAAAGADSGVYLGFGNIAVSDVNGYLGKESRTVIGLGKLDSFPCDKWMDRAIRGLRSSDWDSITVRNYQVRREGDPPIPLTLQEVVSHPFLKLGPEFT